MCEQNLQRGAGLRSDQQKWSLRDVKVELPVYGVNAYGGLEV
jgi:hypothetical protein